ncbi:MAG: prolipoprotein diacylglyceryl transferase [Oscillospiraceae bacterium]|jgi:phosphatidylglycerol:prolipoprotein diacylglycerol transferase|nr:prolipoprotein diacylglyceryl transferase [Oscillospiraceae bacterium]
MSPISFPGLGFEINPSAGFTIPGTGFEIKWYGVIIAVGVLLAVIYATKRSKQFGVTQDDILNMLIIGLPVSVICARLYYVVFQWNEFFGAGIKWWHFLEIRTGGLAIYGGVIGAALTVFIYCRVKKLKMTPFLDVVSIGFLLGQAIGRWGNFMNREAHGSVTTNFLRMGLVENGQLQYFHPTFLYESLWNLVGFVLLHFLSKKRKYDGQISLCYLAWYGLGRLFIEGLRTDSLYIGPLRVSQWLAGASFLLAAGVLVYMARSGKDRKRELWVNRAQDAQ